jgi:hypothetical protein
MGRYEAMSVSKYSTNYFDEAFFTGQKGLTQKRNQDSGQFFVFAVKIFETYGKKGYDWLEVGCGWGWRMKHLQNLGENARGFDVGEYAIKNSVAKNAYVDNIIDLKSSQAADVIYTVNVIEYLDPKDIQTALKNLWKLTKKYLIFSVVCTDSNCLKNQHIDERLYWEGTARLTRKPKKWWEGQFKKAGIWKYYNKKESMKYGWDSFWIMERK